MAGIAAFVTAVPISTSSCASEAIPSPHHRMGCGAGTPAGNGGTAGPAAAPAPARGAPDPAAECRPAGVAGVVGMYAG
ncbi:hypothetical protein [Streptomyces sp. NPDC088170]|uniref:hypothetical protein n=1 Tax=Streptomyces sp. NPDC088170 TaxID=3365834 RepID=UPI003805E183